MPSSTSPPTTPPTSSTSPASLSPPARLSPLATRFSSLPTASSVFAWARPRSPCLWPSTLAMTLPSSPAPLAPDAPRPPPSSTPPSPPPSPPSPAATPATTNSAFHAALSRDTLHIADDIFPVYTFGCLQKVMGSSVSLQGLLVFGCGPASLLSQTQDKYRSTFSYCLPNFLSLNFFGSLWLGPARQPIRIKTTPLLQEY
ncbi:hypothetical protein Taro_049039 [Colocasia esculenta]|uniref:Xylanase inhibitor N-terminal domain-containing protein n=1 Tax=Colocasia esculenta TaxID=4460 RepID=A0A843X9S6_COLES|nr:hypothetical protein [Colocasia esculenta]